MIPRASASEFPHDNPELSDGAVWVCPRVCASPRARREPAPVLPPRQAALRTSLRADLPVESPPAPLTAFDRFVGAMARVALATGGTRAAAELPRLLANAEISASLGPSVIAALRARGIVSRETDLLTAEFRERALGWRDVLRGTSADFERCGASTLDTWAAELLAALLGWPERRIDELRRALRREGVVAFGLLEAA